MSADNSNNSVPPIIHRQIPQNPGNPSFLHAADDEIDLWELWDLIWRGKWVIVVITALFAAGSALYALSLPDIYRSQVLLAPSEEAQGGGIPRMAGQLGGLASLAGINLGASSGSDKVAIAIAVMKSRSFIADFVDRYDILPELMAVERWVRKDNTLVFDPDLYAADRNEWVRDVQSPFMPKPSALEAYAAFTDILSVSQDKETGFVTAAIEHQSPHVAERWVRLLVEDVNAVMKEKDVGEAQRSIDFLQKQLSRVALAEMRSVFYQLIEEQTKTVMLAEVRDEYVFSTIDPPVVAEVKAKPKRTLIFFMGVVLGGVFALIFVLMRHFLGSRRNSRVRA